MCFIVTGFRDQKRTIPSIQSVIGSFMHKYRQLIVLGSKFSAFGPDALIIKFKTGNDYHEYSIH